MVFFYVLQKTTCKNRDCKPNFVAFNINTQQIDEIERDFNPDFITCLALDQDYERIYAYARQLDGNNAFGLPEELPDNWRQDESFLQTLYFLLLRLEIVKAQLQCPKCQAEYQIENKVIIMSQPLL